MARERPGAWMSGLKEVRLGVDHPANQPTTQWLPNMDSMMSKSFALHKSAAATDNAVYEQQQSRFFQPRSDCMSMWGDIHAVVAHNDFNAGEAIRKQGNIHHETSVMRPHVVFMDAAADEQHASTQNMLMRYLPKM